MCNGCLVRTEHTNTHTQAVATGITYTVFEHDAVAVAVTAVYDDGSDDGKPFIK